MNDWESQRTEARNEIISSAHKFANAWEEVDGAYITGYVLVLEVVRVEYGGVPYVQWLTGNGAPPNQEGEDVAGLAAHRVEGMLRKALRDVVTDSASSDL